MVYMFNDARFIADDDDFDENGILKDGRSIRVRMTMMDAAPEVRRAERRDARRTARDARRAAASTSDPVKIAEAVTITRMAMDSGLVDLYSDHKPGWRLPVADDLDTSKRRRSAVVVEHTKKGHTVSVSTVEESNDGMSARDAYILEMCDAWKTPAQRLDANGPEVAPWSKTRAIPTRPDGAYAPVGLGAKEGDTITWNGSPARLVKRGNWLFPEVINPGPTRSSETVNPGDSMTVDIAAAQKIRDAAYAEYVQRMSQEWRAT
jgi:hypothetical protein